MFIYSVCIHTSFKEYKSSSFVYNECETWHPHTHSLLTVGLGWEANEAPYVHGKETEANQCYKTLIGFPAIANFGLNVGAIIAYLFT